VSINHPEKLQKRKVHQLERANSLGIFPIRRNISPACHDVFYSIIDVLEPEILGSGYSILRNLGVTIIGFSRFDQRHRHNGPPTKSIIDRVTSSNKPIETNLGSLAIFGSEIKSKLAVRLDSLELKKEQKDFEETFNSIGYPLKDGYNDRGIYNPHCSVYSIDSCHAPHFKDQRILDRLTNLVHTELRDLVVSLDPVHIP
jgi:hypothetical protein